MKNILIFFTASVFLFTNCGKESEPVAPNEITYGKNRFTLSIDGDTREYYVHVPAGYDGNTALPVVFMLHGTSGDGEEFYGKSGWKEVGEKENILTVFPSSWRYCIIDPQDGPKNTTKWNTTPDAEWVFCQGEKPRDDTKFLRNALNALKSTYKVDGKRVYLAGFSNGGQMAAKCAIEMNDVLAAVVESAGSFVLDTIYMPNRKIPVTYQIGNDDWGAGNEGPDLPLSQFDTLLNAPAFRFFRIKERHINHFGLNPEFTISGDTTKVVIANFQSATNTPNNVFHFVLIKNMQHIYPNGINHPLNAAELNWNWFKQFSIP